MTTPTDYRPTHLQRAMQPKSHLLDTIRLQVGMCFEGDLCPSCERTGWHNTDEPYVPSDERFDEVEPEREWARG